MLKAHLSETSEPLKPEALNVGALIIRIGFGCILYYSSNKQPRKTLFYFYEGPYIAPNPIFTHVNLQAFLKQPTAETLFLQPLPLQGFALYRPY